MVKKDSLIENFINTVFVFATLGNKFIMALTINTLAY